MAAAPLLFVLGTLCLVLFIVSLCVGTTGLSISKLFHANPEERELLKLIILEIRMPRSVLALIVGASLGLGGAVLQGLLRNPLAEPGLIGSTACAALGAVLTFYFGWAATNYALPLGGITGALLGLMLVGALAGRSSTLSLILAGLAINTLAGAATSLALNLAPSPYAALEIVFWMLGSVADRSTEHVWIALPFVLAGWFLLIGMGRAIDALSLGETAAMSLGVNLASVRVRAIAGVGLSVGACVSIAGNIAFIGLIVPHVMRNFVSHKPSRLLPASALAGGALCVFADICVRLLDFSPELKLGVLTSLIGAPFFLYLLYSMRRSHQ